MDLSDDLLINIMLFLGFPEMKILNKVLDEIKYKTLEDKILKFIMTKCIKIDKNGHVLIEINPRRKISMMTENKFEIEKQFKLYFLKEDNFNMWIRNNFTWKNI